MAAKAAAGNATSQPADSTAGLAAARRITPRACGAAARGGAGVASAHVARTPAITTTELKTISGPIASATEPATGPIRLPAVAAASAVPMSSPRRSGGAAPMSQVSAPAQVNAPAKPCTKRAMSSSTMFCAKPKTRLETAMPARAARTVGRAPNRAATSPPGIEPMNVPAG
jgi:hypothetical protein